MFVLYLVTVFEMSIVDIDDEELQFGRERSKSFINRIFEIHKQSEMRRQDKDGEGVAAAGIEPEDHPKKGRHETADLLELEMLKVLALDQQCRPLSTR